MNVKLIKIVVFQSIAILILLFICLSLYYNYEATTLIINSKIIVIKNIAIKLNQSFTNFIGEVKNEYSNPKEVFNARELATFTWMIIALAFFFISNKTRKSLIDIFRALLNRKLIKVWMGVAIYSWFITLGLIYLKFWNVSLLKISVFWFFTAGLATTFRAFNKIKDVGYIGFIIKENLKYTILIEFVTNMYAFPFYVEFILLPLLLLLYLMVASIDTNKNDEDKTNLIKLKNIIQYVIGIIGLVILYHSAKSLIISWKTTNFISTTKEMILPAIMSITLVIFNYYWVLKANYETVIIRLSSKKTIEDKYRWILYFRIKMTCGLSIKRIRNFIDMSEIMTNPVCSFEDVNETMKRFNNNWDSTESFI